MPVMGIVDINAPMLPNQNSAPPMYHGPAGNEWTKQKLGNIFGVTLDGLGNIFVTATSAYQVDYYTPAGPGAIYKIANGTGVVSTFAVLLNTAPSLGNITYDSATRMFDMMIDRIS